MGSNNTYAAMDGFEILDALSLAKEVQWEIAATEDPTEASLKGSVALADIWRMDDLRMRPGTDITVGALGAMIMDVALDDGRRASAQLDTMVLQGVSAGIGFIQNIGKPKIQTLFLGIRSARALEASNDKDGLWVSRLGEQPLIVPVLDITGLTKRV